MLGLPPLWALLILVGNERSSSSRILRIDSDNGKAGQVGGFCVLEAGGSACVGR